MLELLQKIAPLKRTLACNDTDRALQIVAEHLPGARIEGYATGSKAWSWTLPRRWELEGATIHAGGKLLVDAEWSHLHVLNYSQAFSGTVSREQLLPHLHTQPARPEAIPFEFSFYEPRWGFCVPHAWLERFSAPSYEVEIRSRFEDGKLNVLSHHLAGEHPETFILCANICHPLQANDSLTGLAAAVEIMKALAARPKRKYSYLLLVVPEMIGSIAYFAHHPEIVERSVGGFFSEMLGTQGPLVLQRTRNGSTYWDALAQLVLAESGTAHSSVAFLKSAANDEKVMDSPGVDIPTFSLTRFPYPEYHSSDDNLALIDPARLLEATRVLQRILEWAEDDYLPLLKQPGPVFLSGHGLYPDWHANPQLLPYWKSFIEIMYALDGKRSLVELAAAKAIPLPHVRYWADAFLEKGLLVAAPFRVRRGNGGG